MHGKSTALASIPEKTAVPKRFSKAFYIRRMYCSTVLLGDIRGQSTVVNKLVLAIKT